MYRTVDADAVTANVCACVLVWLCRLSRYMLLVTILMQIISLSTNSVSIIAVRFDGERFLVGGGGVSVPHRLCCNTGRNANQLVTVSLRPSDHAA